MNIPGFAAEASLDSFRASYRGRGGFQSSPDPAVVPAKLTACQLQCDSDWHELYYDCLVECGGNSICAYRCHNAWQVGLAKCYAQCAKGIG
jgi:hypothetical protein